MKSNALKVMLGVVAIVIAAIVIVAANRNDDEGYTFVKPTDLVATPVVGKVGAFDLAWRYPKFDATEVTPRFTLMVDNAGYVVVDANTDGVETYLQHVTGQTCGTMPVSVVVDDKVEDTGRAQSDIIQVTLPCPSPVATTAPTATTTAPPAETSAPSSLLAAPTNLVVTDQTTEYIGIEWEYPEGAEVVPDHFNVLFDGEVVNEAPWNGDGYGNSWVTPATCGLTKQVVVVAVKGDDESAPTEQVEVRTPDC